MDVYLAEKPAQAEDIARALGNATWKEGYFQVDDETVVTYAKGHLLQLFRPDDYDPKYKRWQLEDLPIRPAKFKKRAKKNAAGQIKIIQDLLNKASCVYISTDLDREGEAIARDILAKVQYHGPLKRIRITALDELSLKSALADPRHEQETAMLADAADARSKADWAVGMNLSRLFTLVAQKYGMQEVFHVGRVAVPTVALVVNRDQQIREFKPAPYFTLKATFDCQGQTFDARWIAPEDYCDERGRCIEKSIRDNAKRLTQGASGKIVAVESKENQSSAPLPYDLTSIQAVACSRWSYTSAEVLSSLQRLYEHHKAITYPRTANRYLPSNFSLQAESILAAIEGSDKYGAQIVKGVQLDRIPSARVFDDELVDPAHHAIIPTRHRVSMSSMNAAEARLYHLICRTFCAQFYPPCIVAEKRIDIDVQDQCFTTKAKSVLQSGWKTVLGRNLMLVDEADTYSDQPPDLPDVSYDDYVTTVLSKPEDRLTSPPNYFTESSLISAMRNIGRFVEDEAQRKTLDQTAGIGTASTRAEIISQAVERGYLNRETHKKRITSTDKGKNLIAVLPAELSSPATTAHWEMRLESVVHGQLDPAQFTEEVQNWVSSIVTNIKQAI